MDEREFEKVAGEALAKLAAALENVDGLDVDLEGGILTLAFDDRTKFVVNSHSAARQIWLSANMTAWHFSFAGGEWKDARSGAELFAELGSLVSGKLAQPVRLRS